MHLRDNANRETPVQLGWNSVSREDPASQDWSSLGRRVLQESARRATDELVLSRRGSTGRVMAPLAAEALS